MTKATEVDAAKAKAEALFAPQKGDNARQASETEKAAEAEKTARLRALRLAKEESDRKAAEIRKARRDMRAP